VPPRGISMPKRWHINATLLLFLQQRGKFAATNATYQCHIILIFATMWQMCATAFI